MKRTAMRRTPMVRRRARPRVEQDVRATVLGRDGYRCTWCDGSDGLQVHHRRPAGAGGSRLADTNLPGNLLTLCAACHAAVESDREDALEHGRLVRQGHVPAAEPVLWRGALVLLDDQGGVTALPADPWAVR